MENMFKATHNKVGKIHRAHLALWIHGFWNRAMAWWWEIAPRALCAWSVRHGTISFGCCCFCLFLLLQLMVLCWFVPSCGFYTFFVLRLTLACISFFSLSLHSDFSNRMVFSSLFRLQLSASFNSQRWHTYIYTVFRIYILLFCTLFFVPFPIVKKWKRRINSLARLVQ